VARTRRPVIIFIDEIDAVGRQRGGANSSSGHDERDQTLNQILVEMDGFAPNQGIIVLAATNRVDILDAALKRPGRFDYQVLVDLPDLAGREAIFKIHTKNKPLAQGVDNRLLAARTPGFSGADIEAVANEAATLAAERVEQQVMQMREQNVPEEQISANVVRAITLEEFDEAVDIVQMGEARTSRAHAMTRADMLQTAYHEVGHAAVMKARNGDPITKITIVPRARALGYTQSLPEADRFNMTEEQLRTRIMMAMGGRVAQEVFLNTVDTGASNDFKQASNIARRMVTEFGMTELGPIHIDDQELSPFAGGFYGPELLNRVNSQWTRILVECKEEARQIIEANRERIERVVAVLMEKETILGPEFRQLWDETPGADTKSEVAGSDTAGGAN
jgi:cell division protease FtsH